MIENAIKNFLLGLVPDFVWDILPYWPYVFWSLVAIGAIGIGYRIYKLGGWPALTAAVGAAGVALGWVLRGEHQKPASPPTKQPKPTERSRQARPTILDDTPLSDIFKRRKK